MLRHDPTGKADRVLALVEKAGREPLTSLPSEEAMKLLPAADGSADEGNDDEL